MRPAPRRPGNSSTWSVSRAPAESTSQNTGSSCSSAYSVSRTIFSTVRAPQEPALTVESFAITHTGRPSMVPTPVITPSAGRSPARALARSAFSTNDPVVEQEVEPVAHEQLALPCELLGLLVEVAAPGPLGGGVELVGHARSGPLDCSVEVAHPAQIPLYRVVQQGPAR